MSSSLDLSVSTRLRLRRLLYATTAALTLLTVARPISGAIAQVVGGSTATVTGVVFADGDGDGQRDSDEVGVSGVTVSDGKVMTETAADGRYSLVVDPTRRTTDIVFVTQPAGYRVPTNEYMTPRFYRDLGQLAADAATTADFPLVPDPRTARGIFSFANVADPHVNPQLPQQLEEINSTSTELGFVQVSGDLTNNATAAEFQRYLDSTKVSRLPVWPAAGNHEYSSGTTYAARIENYRKFVGPEWYSFDYGDRHFVVLENNGAAPFDEQLEWVRADLAANAVDRRVVVLTHQPMNVPFGSPSQYDAFGDLFEQYDTELVLVGHEHSNDVELDSVWVDGARHIQTSSSSYTIDNSPRGFRYVHMQGERVETPFRMYGVEQSLTITYPTPDAEVPRNSLWGVQVNAHDTSEEVRRVRYRIDKGKWHELSATGDFTWYENWTGPALAVGRHTIVVDAFDRADRKWQKTASFEVVEGSVGAPQTAEPWEQLHGDPAHAGVASTAVGPAMQLAWSHRTDATYLTGSPVIADGVVYAGTRDDSARDRAVLHAIDASTGRQLWEFKAPSSIHGTPAVADGRVLVPTVRGSLIALDAADGRVLWRHDPAPGDTPYNQRSYSYYSPAAADGRVYWAYQTRYGPASQGLLVALDPVSGAIIWQAALSGATMSDGTPTVSDGRVFVGNQTADRVLAFDAATGAKLWQSSATLGGWQDGNPAAADGRVFIGSNNGLVARDAATGLDLWSYRSPFTSYVSSGATPSAPAVHGDTVFMGFPDGSVVALDARIGAPLWRTELPGTTYHGGVHSSPVVSGDTLFVGSNNGRLYALDLHTGQPLWDFEVGTWVAAGPAVSGNTLVAGAWDGNLYAFTPGGRAAPRWAQVTGRVLDDAGAPLAGTRVDAVPDDDTGSHTTTTDADGHYRFGLPAGAYVISASKRGHIPADEHTSIGESGGVVVDLTLTEVRGPVAGVTTVPPDFGAGSTRLDVVAGDTYHYVQNERIQASIVSRVAAHQQAGTFQGGWLADLALTDDTALEVLDWSELILTANGKDMAHRTAQWGWAGEWLDLSNVRLDGASVVASGTSQANPGLTTSLQYRALPDAPIVKMSLTITNHGSADYAGYFQYLLDPDSSQDIALVPGMSQQNPGLVRTGWNANYLYDGPTTAIQSPAQGVAWVEDEPTGLAAYGYIGGAWFNADVAAGATRTISWYQITDYPAEGSPANNIAAWAAALPTIDPALNPLPGDLPPLPLTAVTRSITMF